MNLKGSVNEYVFNQGTKVEIPTELLSEIRHVLGNVIEENSEPYFNDKFKYINTKTSKEVKTFKEDDLSSGKIKKVIDIEGTLNSTAKVYRKPLALRTINLQLSLDELIIPYIEKGDAVHYTDLEKVKED